MKRDAMGLYRRYFKGADLHIDIIFRELPNLETTSFNCARNTDRIKFI
jgi:hypothetical protein